MESNKLDIAAKEKEPLAPASSYKPILDEEMNGGKSNEGPKEPDGADEKMLLNEDQKLASNSHVKASDVKFIKSDKQNGDTKLDIGSDKDEFVGLTKEELMKFANDPFWVRLRWFLFISFWLLWAGMLVGAIMIIIAAPKCSPPVPKTWWEEGPLVEVTADVDDAQIASLKSQNIMGIIVPYPEDTYKPLNASNFTAFLQKHKDWNVIVQLNPTVSTVWFDQSINKAGNYNDYYVWAGPEGANSENHPNNWLSKTSTSDVKVPAWKYAEKRKQFYLADDEKAPKLNFRNEEVRKEFLNVLEQFLNLGVDGFALEGIPRMLVDPSFADEAPRQSPSMLDMNDYNFYTHFKTEDSKDLAPVIKEWRDKVKAKSADAVFMLTDELHNLEAYKFNGTLLVDLPRQNAVFNRDQLTAPRLVKDLETISHISKWPAFKISNSNYPKSVLETASYLLKGTTILDADFHIVEELKEARKSPSVMYGSQIFHTAANNTVLTYVRIYPGNPGYLVAFNPTSEMVTVNFPMDVLQIPEEVTVHYFSPNYNETGVDFRLKKDAREFPITAQSAVILSFVPGTI